MIETAKLYMPSNHAVVALLLAASSGIGKADDTPDQSRIDFVRDIRPIFAQQCYGCHGAKAQKSDFRLDRKTKAMAGGGSGERAIVPGAPGDSQLVERIASNDPETRMPPEGRPLSAKQIELIRTWVKQGAVWPEQSQTVVQTHWALIPPRRWPLPKVNNPQWIANPIDAFVLAKLEQADLGPSRPADRITLVRRLFYDLLGLPPTPDQVDDFVRDQAVDAYERLVDRLLASPQYGERWGRHWLDVVRFAETSGYECNTLRPTAWHYRDWVIASLNADKPYDQFIIEQLVGDAMGADVATGFIVAGPFDDVSAGSPVLATKLRIRQDELHGFVTSTAETFLGLTVGCARCHDHKFDPIAQADYYALQAVFAGATHPERDKNRLKGKPYAPFFEQPKEPTHRLYRGDPLQKREEVTPAAIQSLGDPLELEADAPEQQRRLALARWLANPNNVLTARVMGNRLWQYHFGRGLVATPNNFGVNGIPPSHPQLLDWLATELIARNWSMKAVHRLVVTSSTYRQSAKISERGNAELGANNSRWVDPEARLLWRFPSRRLEAEAIRDTILFVSGKLNAAMGGPGYSAFHPTENPQRRHVPIFNPKLDFGPAEWRRMVYQWRIRMELDAIFGSFDSPDGGQSCPKRGRSTTPMQALNLFNSDFVAQQAGHFARRIQAQSTDTHEQLDRAFRFALARHPTEDEQAACLPVIEQHGLETVCRVIFNMNEFLFMP